MKRLRRGGWLVLTYAIILHATWGVLLVTSDHKLRATPLTYVLEVFGQRAGGLAFLAAAAAALWGMFRPGWRGFYASVPQNAMLFLAASAGIVAVASGHYPDGVVRPQEFILADQIPMILIAPLHAAALAFYHGAPWGRPWTPLS